MKFVYIITEVDDLANPRGLFESFEDAKNAAELVIKESYSGKRHFEDDFELATVSILRVALNKILDSSTHEYYEKQVWDSLNGVSSSSSS